MKTYMVPAMAMAMATVIELPCPQTPVRGVQAERSLQEIASKISEKIDIFSSPTRRKIDSTIRGVQNVLLTAEVWDRQYEDLHNRVQNQQKSRIRGNRKVLQKGGVLIGTQAQQIQENKREKEQVDRIKRRQYLIRITTNKIKKKYHIQGVAARKSEKERQRTILNFKWRKEAIPIELFNPIPDPEKPITDKEIDIQVKEALISLPEFNGVSFEYEELGAIGVIDPGLQEFTSQQDFISFEGTNIWGRDSIASEDEEDEDSIQDAFSYL
ncbi:hypothetical protein VC83_06159 [Pseudogymnoascus destructans]|uniref:Uncharacterized protein n=1 Tax=Pseudogymnoascus destructans TaxID=655981 RepID=A0A177A9T0_9PEZI|nr:uncharacterized protein VC83_06159 [Pseudogymnoascus destructans]OAF58889.1 hypothetical protein VC83_06159 [Pseudogymnoascus destructans]